MKRTKRLEATAYHEAGHAVAAWRLGLEIPELTIIATEGAAGSATHTSPLWGVDRELDGSEGAGVRMERSIIASLAGPAAQRHYSPRSWRRHHGAGDHDHATELAIRAHGVGEIATAYLEYLIVVTRVLVTGARWPVVCVVAGALLDRGTLSSDETRAVILQAAEEYRLAGGSLSPHVPALPPTGAEAELLALVRGEGGSDFTVSIQEHGGRAIGEGDTFSEAWSGVEPDWAR